MSRSRRVAVVVAGVLLVAGVGAGIVLATGDDGEPRSELRPGPAPAGSDPFAPEQPPAPGPAPGTPEAAATAFLTAEAADDPAASFAVLSPGDREHHVVLAGWEEAHAEMWDVTGFRLEGTARRGGDVTVDARVELQPALDPVLGLVPAEARLTLPLVEEDGGWRVAFSDSTYQPLYLDDEGAPDAVRSWAESRRRCGSEAEWDGGLLGADYLGDELCGAEGRIDVGPVGTIDRLPDATPYLDDFGADAADWARVVPVSGAVELDAVAAPLGERWVVIGVTPAEGD
jgi:hypothetical protein